MDSTRKQNPNNSHDGTMSKKQKTKNKSSRPDSTDLEVDDDVIKGKQRKY